MIKVSIHESHRASERLGNAPDASFEPGLRAVR